jgi:predicted DsbA family dithiol-disulfide isomerase
VTGGAPAGQQGSPAVPVVHIEFFHDVLCAFCFIESPRLRRLAAEDPGVEIVHRAFALAPSAATLHAMFGGAERAKTEILRHWRAAARLEPTAGIDPDLMAGREFGYPHSMPGLLATKAAAQQGREWDVYDRVQRAHLVEARDIEDTDVLVQIAADLELDPVRFAADIAAPRTRAAVEADLARSRELGVRGVPALVADGRVAVSGAVPHDDLVDWVSAVRRIRTGRQ